MSQLDMHVPLFGQTKPVSSVFFVRLLRWVLPIVLFVLATGYETWEHVISKGDALQDINMSAEVFFFGLAGPTAVFVVLSYVAQLMEAHEDTMRQLRELNQELERRVAKRTEELKKRNQELANANAELKKVDQLKSDFIALVSHELLTPLTTVNGGLELLMQQRETLPENARQRLCILSREIQRLTTLVHEILDLSRLEAGKLNLNAGLVALGPLLTRVIETVATGREVYVKLPPAIPPLWGDEIYIEEILRNVIGNAVKHTPTGTPIEVTVEPNHDVIDIVVTDHGPGIPAERQKYIFEQFYRVQYGERQETTGWGLGLYLTRRLVELHGGTIRVESPAWPDPEHPGARFIITLPAAPEDVEDDL